MDRLTARNGDGSVSQPTDLRWAEALDKLAAYEDTGLSPKEIREMMTDWLVWKQAETEDRLIVLPCKVGTKVYDILSGKIQEKYYAIMNYRDEDFGKTVFLSHEEAEKALEAEK